MKELGLETVAAQADAHGIPVDACLRAADRLWAVGDIHGIWQLTHLGKNQGEVVAANIPGERRAGSAWTGARHQQVAGFVDTPLSAAILGDQLDARRAQASNRPSNGRPALRRPGEHGLDARAYAARWRRASGAWKTEQTPPVGKSRRARPAYPVWRTQRSDHRRTPPTR